MKHSLGKRCRRISPYLPAIIVALFCLQPILDILSYWQDALHLPFSMSFVPRTLLLLAMCAGGFALSERKRYYWIIGSILVAFYGIHVVVLYQNGIISIVEDASAYIRVMQLPVTTLFLITCLRCNGKCYQGIIRGVVASLAILAVSFAVSTATGTDPMTYPYEKVGVRGYSFWPNAQSAILSLSAPLCMGWILKLRGGRSWKDTLLCSAVMGLSMFLLYIHGTRLAFGCMLMAALGMAIMIFVTHEVPRRYALILLAFMAIGTFAFTYSPTTENHQKIGAIQERKKSISETLLDLGEAQLENGQTFALDDSPIARPTGLSAFTLPNPPQAAGFADTNASDWNARHLAYCQTLGIISALDNTNRFYPNAHLSKGEFCVIVTRVYEMYHGVQAYPDYIGSDSYDVYVKRALEYGLLRQQPDNIDTPINRGRAAEALYELFGGQELDQLCQPVSFEDVPSTHSAYKAVSALQQAGILVSSQDRLDRSLATLRELGVTLFDTESDLFNQDLLEADNLFRPSDKISRGDFCAMLAALINPDFRKCDEGFTRPQVTTAPVDLSLLTDQQKEEIRLYPLYYHYCQDLVKRFGIRKVLDCYGSTTDTKTLLQERQWKLNYGYMLMDESTPASRLFGLELSRMFFEGESYDVENDFHGIYLLYGWVGLALMLLFIGFFLFLIVKALVTNFKRYFTLEAGAVGISLIACLAHAYFTCGVLRRANALFYLAAILACVYYLVVLKSYPDQTNHDLH